MSCRGVQYLSIKYSERLEEAKIGASVASGAYAAPPGPRSPFAVGDSYEFKQVRAADQMIRGII